MDKILHQNAIVGQSGGPTSAINATLAGVISGVLESEETGKIYGMKNGIEGLLKENIIDLSEVFLGNEKLLKRLSLTPAAALGSCRKKLPSKEDADYGDIMEKIFSVFEKYDIGYFFYIGGNDSMDTVAKLSAYAEEKNYKIKVIGVPKTVDNDLVLTDHTPGFGSAAKYIAVTVQEIIRDTSVYTVPAVTVIEMMGRDTGWLTAASALGKSITGYAPDLIYLPERNFDFDSFYKDVELALKKHPNVVIAVSEGLRSADGTYVGEGTQSGSVDIFGHKYLAGTAKALELAIKEKFGCKVRSVELNLPQRCAGHLVSARDISESVEIGKSAVKFALCGVSREMICIKRLCDSPYSYEISHEDIDKIANKVKYVPDEFINENSNGINDCCIDYLLPLIQGEIYPEYESGLPCYLVL